MICVRYLVAYSGQNTAVRNCVNRIGCVDNTFIAKLIVKCNVPF